MSCEKYKAALVEAAVTSADLTPELRSHVASCASCAAELAQQRSLIAAIDANLHRQMNAPLPAAMLLRLEARLAQEPQSQPSPSLRFTWLYAAAALATVSALILFVLPRVRQHKANDHTAAIPQTVQSVGSRPQMVPLVLKPATPEEIRRDRAGHSRRSVHAEPEVIVPPDERIALEHFVADLHGRGEVALALTKRVREQREQNVVPVVTPEIQIASLTVSPIRDTDVSTNSSTNR